VTSAAATRTIGCLKGLATGDAIGKQTEMLSHDDVARWYPQGVRGFEGIPGAIIPRYIGNRKREWRIGETTDDTERTIAVARAIVADRKVSHLSVGRELLRCEKCVHPGLRSLWEFHQAADPARIAVEHDGCGAAVRVAPVGILLGSTARSQLVDGARAASISTHGGALAIAAAAATAAAVSAAIDGAPPQEVLDIAVEAAACAERRQVGGDVGRFAAAIRSIHERLAGFSSLTSAGVAACCFPDRPLTIVPLALGLATIMPSAEEAILLAANVGGDSDSVASIAGAILGAMYPTTINETWFRIVEEVNQHGLVPIALELVQLRRGPEGTAHA
jgi:ADP-ribosylglycohydrolase